MYKLLLTLLVLFPSTVYAEVKAVIKAPLEVNIGDLVILDSSESIGANQLWVIDPRAAGRYLELDNRVVFAIGTPGIYSFQLIVADTDASIDQVKHEVKVGNVSAPPIPPTDPAPPTDPPTDPVPPPANKSVLKAVQAATKFIDDPTTATALRNALLSLPEKTPATVQEAISNVFLNRKDQSKDWLNLWRIPVNSAIDRAGLPYEEVVKQIIEGLDPSANVLSASTLTFYIRDNCPPCDKWKEVVLPIILSYGWVVDDEVTTTKSTPSFDISTNGKMESVEGYMTFEQFSTIVSEMRK